MDVSVMDEGMVKIENGQWCFMLDGEREVRTLIKKLINVLFDLRRLKKK